MSQEPLKFGRKALLEAIKSLDKPAPVPTLFYGGYLGLPLEWFPNVPDGGVFGSFRHIKTKKLGVNDLL